MYDTQSEPNRAQHGAAAYGAAALRTGRPGARLSLVINAYDRALECIARAAEADRDNRLDDEFRAAMEAIALFQGLDSMVDPGRGDIATSLRRTYELLNRALHGILRLPDGAAQYDRLHDSITELRDAWKVCALKV